MTDQELRKLRQDLLDDISYSDFKWNNVTLEYKKSDGSTGKVVVEVSSPVRKGKYWVPVTAKETFAFARRFGWEPLTRAVADQAHNQAVQFEYKWHPDLTDFPGFDAKTLDPMYLAPYNANQLVSGAHKLWVLSKFGGKKSVNYGFYMKANKGGPGPNGGPKLNSGWRLKQTLGSAHDENHWDYSQLLQLMKTEKPLEVDGKFYSLAMALVAGLEAFWDETSKLKNSDLP